MRERESEQRHTERERERVRVSAHRARERESEGEGRERERERDSLPYLLPFCERALAESCVLMYPGDTTVTTTPFAPTSHRSESKYPCNACLDAASEKEEKEEKRK